MLDGGIRIIECTYDACGKISDEETAENIKILSDFFKDKMVVGAGTVLTQKQVELKKQAGGKLIISPDTNYEIIKRTNELDLVSIPGAMTPSEIAYAQRMGADFVKVFPVNFAGGAEYIKAVKAPLSNVRLLAVNGVNAENLQEYINAGACGFGIGSGIVNKEMINTNNFEGITKLAEEYTAGLNLLRR